MARRLAALAVLLAVHSLFSLAHAAEKIKITHLSATAHSESWQNYLHEMAELFVAEYPHYEIDIQTGNDEKFLTMTLGGVTPDVTDLPTHGQSAAVADGLFINLRPLLEREPDLLAKYPPAILDALTTPDGILFMLPIEIYSIVTWYNVDMLNEAGLALPADLGDDWTWETMTEYARKLTKRDSNGVVTVWGLDSMTSRPYIQTVQAGGNFFNRDIFPTESRLLSEPVITGIEFIRRLIWEEQVTRSPQAAARRFYQSGAAIDVIDGPGILGTYMRGVDFAWDVTLQPHGPANNATNVSLNGYMIHSYSANQDAAWEWVKFIATTEDAQQRFARHTGRLPIFREVAEIWDRLLPVPLPSNWTAFFEQSIHPANIYLKEGVMRNTQITTILSQQLGRVWRGEASTRAALEEADRQIRPLLAGEI